jgi:23S rRNA (adenine2503-C2)-methyltransferase
MNRKSLCGLSLDEIIQISGTDLLHATSIANCLYKRRVTDIDQFKGISKQLKKELKDIYYMGFLDPVASLRSRDSSVKYLFRNRDGLEYETVYLPDSRRTTVCVSTQSGCRMNCSFCVTGKYGFYGNLSVQDILNQVINLPESDKVTHVVFMGMGEPMDNLDNVLKACQILCAEWGPAISRRNITVSTVGITPGIKKFLQLSECNLAFSLHSPFADERREVIPAENKYPASEIIGILKKFPAINKRRFSVAYVMISGVNDTDLHLEELKTLLHNSPIRVNLLRYHSHYGDTSISSTPERMQFFKHALITSGISASIRKSRGEDISAACGLLAAGLKQE